MNHNSWTGVFEVILQALCRDAHTIYADRLISLVIFGSVGRASMRPDSDIDVLFVIDPLPKGRLKRMDEFRILERLLEPVLKDAGKQAVTTSFSPVLKTPDEVRLGSPLFLDMVDDSRILYDRGGFFQQQIDMLRKRLKDLGARRVWMGNAWYWDLKPDYKPGEEFSLYS